MGLILAIAVVFSCLPTIGAQQLQVQGVLITDSSTDESVLWVDIRGNVAVDQLIMLESRDRSVRGTYRVRHVFGPHVVIEGHLAEDWVAGSRVLQ